MSIPVTVYESKHALGKFVCLDEEGKPQKRPQAQMTKGKVRTEQLADLDAVAELRASLASNQALGFGVCGFETANLVTKAALGNVRDAQSASGRPVVARDKKHFRWATSAPGILMLDYDPRKGHPVLGAKELVAMLRRALPELASVKMLWTPSASSNIWRGDSEVVGTCGAHIYMVVSDASRIPHMGRLIFNRLALAGHGYIKITSSGRTVNCGPFDANVWQPERLDFVRATCSVELEQRLVDHVMFDAEAPFSDSGALDPDRLVPLSTAEELELHAIWSRLNQDARAEASLIRSRWARAQAIKQLGEGAEEGDIERATRAHVRAAKNCQLLPNHRLYLQDGRMVTVQDLKDRPTEFDGISMYDPHEPDYGGPDPRIAIAFLHPDGSEDPVIFSHAHGGMTYRLQTAEDDLAGVPEDDTGDVPHAAAVRRGSPCDAVLVDREDYLSIAEVLARTEYGSHAAGGMVRWNGEWFQHRGTHYDVVRDDHVEADIWKFLGRCQYQGKDGMRAFKPNLTSVASVTKALQTTLLQRFDSAPYWLDRNPSISGDVTVPSDLVDTADLVSMANGLLHIPSRTLYQHSQRFFSRNALPFNYDPSATCPNWLAFLESVWSVLISSET